MPTYYDPRTGQIVRTQYPIKRQTNVDISQDPGTNYNTSGPGAAPTPTPGGMSPPPPIPSATPVPNPPGGGSVGTGGGGTVNAAGGNISQGAIYGGSVTNTASGGTGSLDSSGGSGNVYRETTSAPVPSPTPSPTTNPGGNENANPDAPVNDCPEGQFPDDETGECRAPIQFYSSNQNLMSTAPKWNAFMGSYMRGR